MTHYINHLECTSMAKEDDVPYDNVEGLAFDLDDLPELILSFEKEIYMYEAILRKIRSNKSQGV